jgi:DnaJ homolog subfamily C member 13
VEDDKLNFRDNLKFAVQYHSNKNQIKIIEKHLEVISLIDQENTVNQAIKNRPVVLRNRRQRKKTSDVVNLPSDHNLIWKLKIRE